MCQNTIEKFKNPTPNRIKSQYFFKIFSVYILKLGLWAPSWSVISKFELGMLRFKYQLSDLTKQRWESVQELRLG